MEDEKTSEQVMIDYLHRIDRTLVSLNQTMAFISMGPDQIKRFSHENHQIAFHLPDAMTDSIQKYIMQRHTFWEDRLLQAVRPHLTGCRNVLDIGANIGNHTVYFSKVTGVEKLTCFEPNPHVFNVLSRNIELNGLTGVIPVNAAVGAQEGAAKLVNSNVNLGKNAYAEVEGGDLKLVSAEAYADEPIDFMKIDVEGQHMAVLEGCAPVMRRDRPKLWIELRKNHGEFEPANAFIESLDLGYRAQAISPNDFLFSAA